MRCKRVHIGIPTLLCYQAELIGAISSVSQLLDTAITLFKHLRQAHKRRKDLVALLNRHLDELENIQDITRIIRQEPALQTTGVNKTLIKLKKIEKALVAWLEENEPGDKGPVRQFSHQLLHGSKNQKSLDEITNELSCLKANLSIYIQVAHVGVRQIARNTAIKNSGTVRRSEERVVRISGKGDGSVRLRDADTPSLNSGETLSTNGSVHLCVADRASLDRGEVLSKNGSEVGEVPPLTKPKAIKKRVVGNNVAKISSTQVNCPIGHDLWEDMDHIEIRDNIAEETSKQFNYPMSLEVFLNLSRL
ncbi:MAG: hypothetical protein M1822_002339 [Bathelium mastoideum]|nr:MAG: hypothetical protein M1822_002339 [Bathelium mastoideum]